MTIEHIFILVLGTISVIQAVELMSSARRSRTLASTLEDLRYLHSRHARIIGDLRSEVRMLKATWIQREPAKEARRRAMTTKGEE